MSVSLQTRALESLIFVSWISVNCVLFFGSYYWHCTVEKFFYLRFIVGKTFCVSRASALCLNFNMSLLILLTCKKTISFVTVQCWLGGSNCTAKFMRFLSCFHRYQGYAICFFTLLHVFSHCINFVQFSQAFIEPGLASTLSFLNSSVNPFRVIGSNPVIYLFTTVPGLTGLLMCIILLLVASSSNHFMRKHHFQTFFNIHRLTLIAMLLFIFHGFQGIIKFQENVADHSPSNCSDKYLFWNSQNNCIVPKFTKQKCSSWIWLLVPFTVYAFENVYVFFKSLYLLPVHSVKFHPSYVVEIKMNHPAFNIKPGQYVMVKCWNISKFEWHPFSVTSAPTDDFLTLHIRACGDWTSTLYALCSDPTQLKIAVDGPYGVHLSNVFLFDVAVLIGCGLGITPFSSLLCEIRNKLKHDAGLPLKKVYVFWICSDSNNFEWFRDLISSLECATTSDRTEGWLNFNLYITKGWDCHSARMIALSANEPYDEITGLHSKTHYGRPDFTKIFERMSDVHAGAKIGVLVCGSSKLFKKLSKLCEQFSNRTNATTKFLFESDSDVAYI